MIRIGEKYEGLYNIGFHPNNPNDPNTWNPKSLSVTLDRAFESIRHYLGEEHDETNCSFCLEPWRCQ